jgi:Uma2 family endonuclease
VVEVAEASLPLDRGLKAGVFARAGIPEYWIVNLVDRVLEVYRVPRRGRRAAYATVRVLTPRDAIAPLAAPRARIRVANLLP